MTELTAEMIVDLAAPGDIALSPDGRWVAYTLSPFSKREEHRQSAVWLAATDGAQPPRPLTAGAAEDRLPRWAPDSRRIAFLSDRAQRGTQQLYCIAVDGGEARPLTPPDNKRPVQTFAWSPDGQSVAFTSADKPSEDDERREKERDDAEVYGERAPWARLRLVRVETGEVTTLFSPAAHVADFAWSPDGQSVACLVRRTPDLDSIQREVEYQTVRVADGTAQRVCRLNQLLTRPVWSDDGGHLLFVAPASGTGQGSHAVWTVPAGGGEARRLALGETSCAGDLKKGADGQGLVVSVVEGLGGRVAWLDPQSGGLDTIYATAAAHPLSDLSGWSAARLTDGTTVLAAAVTTSVRPAEVWTGRALGEPVRLTQRTQHQAALDGVRWGVQEPFTWRAPDGWELDGVLIRPPDAPPGPLPLVTLVHGGPYSRYGLGMHLSWGDWGQWLATAGYAVLMPNYRGGMGHGDRFASAARGGVGEGDFPDILSAVDAAIERGIADPDRLAIGGWSQGGFMTAWAVTHTQRFKAGIMGAGVSDWGMMVMTSDVPDFERELGGAAPWDALATQRHLHLSPVTFARQAATPLLILHGKHDARVPVSQATGFHRALREVGCPSELVVYPREPHGIGERAHQLDVLRRVRAWLDRWLKPSD